MKVLVVGGGGREHAIIRKLRESKEIDQLYCAPGNGGIAADATCIPISATDLQALVKFACVEKMDYVVVAPDDPLCLGLVDMLAEYGIPAFGPGKEAARIEGSKAFAKDMMKKYRIPTAHYRTFSDEQEAHRYVQESAYPLVIKADGLALGKGVLICENIEQAQKAICAMMQEGKYGASGSRVVVEEFLTGPEVSVLCFTDGKTIRPMVSGMDHKRALEGDKGLNTGGMGVIAPNPFYTKEVAAECMQTIFLPTLHAMREEGIPFHGCLYFGLMLTQNGPKVIEYNCRFGDPEAQAVLPLLQSDLFTIMRATTFGGLDEIPCVFSSDASCCVVIASGGYPEEYETGKEIFGLADAQQEALIFHAGTKQNENKRLFTSGGRVLGVTVVAHTLKQARKEAYAAIEKIKFDGMHVRKDIGVKALDVLHNA